MKSPQFKARFPLHEPFEGFGVSRFFPEGHDPGGHKVEGDKFQKLKKDVLEHAPARPGVYAMLDPLGRIVYIGKAKLLRTRLMCYFRTKSRDPKAGRILKRAHAIVWEFATDEFAALLRELELIQRYRPRFNVQGQPGRGRYTYIAISKEPPQEITCQRNPGKKHSYVFGPFISKMRTDRALRRLIDRYQLRDCPDTVTMVFDDGKVSLPLTPHCLRYELGVCAGPCAAKCTQAEYEQRVQNAVAFLKGTNRSILDEVKAEMITAAEAMNYERAAAARDKLSELQWLDARLAQLQRAREQHSYLYPVLAHDGRTVWYLIDRGQVRTVAFGTAKKPPKSLLKPFEPNIIKKGSEVDSVLLVASWFRKFPHEKTLLREVQVR